MEERPRARIFRARRKKGTNDRGHDPSQQEAGNSAGTAREQGRSYCPRELVNEADVGVLRSPLLQNQGEHCCAVLRRASDGEVPRLDEIQVVLQQGRLQSTCEDVGHMRVFRLVEERQEKLDCSCATVVAGRHGRLESFGCLWNSAR